MSEPAIAPRDRAPEQAPANHDGKKAKEEENFFIFVLKLALIVVIFRSFIFSPFNIPSESMLPRLMNGDYLLAAKWSYGYTSNSLPLNAPLIPGRIFADDPEAGDVVIFRHPVDGTDYIKRAIALPGDTVELRDGTVFLNGEALPRQPLDDLLVPISANTDCHPAAQVARVEGALFCRYLRLQETLPNGRSYEIIDLGSGPADNFGPVMVPEGHFFAMGDNRDNSQDSRFVAAPGGGIGMVPLDNLVGRASVLMWSTDGSAEWLLPWTWFSAARWSRIGDLI